MKALQYFALMLLIASAAGGCQSSERGESSPDVTKVSPSGVPETDSVSEDLEIDASYLDASDEEYLHISRWLSEIDPSERETLRTECHSNRSGCIRAIAEQLRRNNHTLTSVEVLEIYRRMGP